MVNQTCDWTADHRTFIYKALAAEHDKFPAALDVERTTSYTSYTEGLLRGVSDG